MESVLYVRRNEPTARIIFIHAYQTIESIPSELGPNIKILDEAFPSITLDLVFLQGTFTPTVGILTTRIRFFAHCTFPAGTSGKRENGYPENSNVYVHPRAFA